MHAWPESSLEKSLPENSQLLILADCWFDLLSAELRFMTEWNQGVEGGIRGDIRLIIYVRTCVCKTGERKMHQHLESNPDEIRFEPERPAAYN